MDRRRFLKYAAVGTVMAASAVAGYEFSSWQNSHVPSLTSTVTKTQLSERTTTTATGAISISLEQLQPGQTIEHPPTNSNPYVFYSYFPRSAANNREVTVGVWPHGDGPPSENYIDHRRMAANTMKWLAPFSERYKVPLVIAAIPRVERLYVHSLHPGTFTTREEMLRRPDLKLIDAVWNQFIPSLRTAGLTVNERVYAMGFSSVGMFAHRFTMIHPERVRACWLGGEAPAPLPADELDGYPLDYPLGMRNIQQLAGRPFDFETYRKVPHFVIVGEKDVNPENDSTCCTDIFTDAQRRFILSRFGSSNPERIRFFYEYLKSVGVPAKFYMYKGIGHEINDQILSDAFEFFAGVPTS